MTTTTKPAKLWRPRIPDAKDAAVLDALYSARLLIAPQLQRLYGLESVGSLHPRLQGLLGPEGTPRILERARGSDGRFYYAVGPEGYRYLPTDPPPARHKPLARVRLSPQWTDHTLAVGWLLTTWLTGGGGWQPEGSTLRWWGEHRAILPYPLPRQRGPVTHGRVEPDGVAVLTRADGAIWTGAIEHDQGSEDAADWSAKLGRWAAVLRCGSWRERFGETAPHLLITVPTEARRAQIAPWVAAGRKEHGGFSAWIAVHSEVSVGEGDGLGVAIARVTAPAWVQVTAIAARPLTDTLATLPAIIEATAPWRPNAATPSAAVPAPLHPAPVDLAAQERTRVHAQVQEQGQQLWAQEGTIRDLQAERDGWHKRWLTTATDLNNLDRRHQVLQIAYNRLLQEQPVARLQHYWAVHHPLALAGRGLACAVTLFAAGVLLSGLWLLSVQTWAAILRWDSGLAAYVATQPAFLALLGQLWQAPWCLGPLLLGSLVGTLAAWHWARPPTAR